MKQQQWFLIDSETSYRKAIHRYEELKEPKRNTAEYKEMMLLAYLINKYENSKWPAFDMDPVEIIKIRMEEFGFKAADLAKEFGDKGAISKVLNYKKPMSLNMIRLFHKVLRIPSSILMKEYELN